MPTLHLLISMLRYVASRGQDKIHENGHFLTFGCISHHPYRVSIHSISLKIDSIHSIVKILFLMSNNIHIHNVKSFKILNGVTLGTSLNLQYPI
jgi:hypothetical protein